MTPDVNATNFAMTARPPGKRGWMLMAPLFAWLMLFVAAPTAIMLLYSFCDRDDIGQVVFQFNLENYRRIFVPEYFKIVGWSLLWAGTTAAMGMALFAGVKPAGPLLREKTFFDPKSLVILLSSAVGYFVMRDQVFALKTGGNFLKILFSSLELAGISTFICVMIGYPVAYFIGRAEERGNKLLMLVMIPFWTNFLIRTYAWITILKGEGMLNGLLMWSKVISEPLPLLYTPTAVVIGTVYAYLPFMILPIYGSVEKLDNSLVEAAFDLGAGPIRAFSNIIVPLTRPGIVAGILLVFVPAVGMFAINDILGGKRDPLIGNVIDQQFKQARNMPFGSALGIILLLLFAVAFFFTLRKQEIEP